MLRLNDGIYPWSFSLGMEDPMLWFFWIMVFAFGCCWGSFLNVCIWRMPRGESVSDAPSHCPKCDMLIRWFDNIPLLSFTLLRGRCRRCKEPISPRYVIVEAFTGLFFLGLFLKATLTGQPPAVLPMYFIMAMLAITTFFIDGRFRIIPDATTYPAILAGVLISAAFPAVWGAGVTYGAAIVMALFWPLLTGGILLSLTLLGRRLLGREAFGLGDVKFMIAACALLGPAGAFFTLFSASLLALLWGAVIARRKKRKWRRIALPFGPFLSIGATVSMFCGELFCRLYMEWIVFLRQLLHSTQGV